MVLALVAENLHVQGETRGAWRDRQLALALLSSVRNHTLLHLMLPEAIFACLEDRMPRGALHLETALVASALRWSLAAAVSEALTRRAATPPLCSNADDLARLGSARDSTVDPSISDKAGPRTAAAEAKRGRRDLLRACSRRWRSVPLGTKARAYPSRLPFPSHMPALDLLLAYAADGPGSR